MTQSVLVVAEQVDGAFRKVTFEALGAAGQIAAQISAEAIVAVLGSGDESVAAELGRAGCQSRRICHLERAVCVG